MFGTMGFSELIIILLIVLIIFGAGRLPQIGEGVGKALKGFRKEVNEVPQAGSGQDQQQAGQPETIRVPTSIAETAPQTAGSSSATTRSNTPSAPAGSSSATTRSNTPSAPGPEQTPGTTASLLYNTNPLTPQPSPALPNHAPAFASNPVLSMEQRAAAPLPRAHAAYPPLPTDSKARAPAKRPSAVVNKDAVARVQAQQAALKAKHGPSPVGVSPEALQHLGEGLGEVVRTYRQAVTEVRTTIDPQICTIQAEMDAAKKEIQQSIEAAKEPPQAQEDPQNST